jgi:DNA-binding PadR family transcriptional regulator
MIDEKQLVDSGFIKQNNFFKHTVNGLYRFLVLWIIKYNGSIHGYSIMKELDNFFETLIAEGALKKSNPSKVYPILRKMEEKELIIGTWEVQDNKNVKYYQITEKGDFLVKYFFKTFLLHEKNPHWNMLFDDLLAEI